MRKCFVATIGFCVASTVGTTTTIAQQPGQPPNFIRENAQVIVLTHVELIDGTGSVPQPDQAVVIDHGKITAVGANANTAIPSGAKVIDATGKTLIPGIVGMHEHIFYPSTADGPLTGVEQFYSFLRSTSPAESQQPAPPAPWTPTAI